MPKGRREMLRFRVMSRLGLAEPLVRLERRLDNSNRAAARRVERRPDARRTPVGLTDPR